MLFSFLFVLFFRPFVVHASVEMTYRKMLRWVGDKRSSSARPTTFEPQGPCLRDNGPDLESSRRDLSILTAVETRRSVLG